MPQQPSTQCCLLASAPALFVPLPFLIPSPAIDQSLIDCPVTQERQALNWKSHTRHRPPPIVFGHLSRLSNPEVFAAFLGPQSGYYFLTACLSTPSFHRCWLDLESLCEERLKHCHQCRPNYHHNHHHPHFTQLGTATLRSRTSQQHIMDPVSSSDRRGGGPQIYVHVEFGVSWNKKPPKNHELTFKSRNMRERAPQFPRQVAAPTTNYLAAIHTFEERRSRTRQPHRVRTEPGEAQHVRRNIGYHNEHQMQEYYHIDPPVYDDDLTPPAGPEQPRQPRGDSRSSHERGRSAPPPLGENPWDVNFARRQQDSTAEPWITPADQWKALPAEPSQFRLGEGGMPWSAWSSPFEDQHEGPSHGYDEGLSTRSAPARERYDFSGYAVPSTYPPGPSMLPRQDESGRVRDLGALSAAMMTVDNGFENQWWNQGEREVVADDPITQAFTAPEPRARTWSPASVGLSAGGLPSEERHSVASIVSPITNNSDSPLPHFQSLHRSLSTRSEELFFPER